MKPSKNQLNKTSKFLSYVLRHRPDEIGLTLDKKGWTNIDALIDKAKPTVALSNELIEHIVVTNDKQRFQMSEDKLQIRANQGHSIEVDLDLQPVTPPAQLYHGTATRFLDSILVSGLSSQQRHHVHLSTDVTTAKSVGRRYGKAVILCIDAQAMHQQGALFYVTANNVWLCCEIPPQFLSYDDLD